MDSLWNPRGLYCLSGECTTFSSPQCNDRDKVRTLISTLGSVTSIVANPVILLAGIVCVVE